MVAFIGNEFDPDLPEMLIEFQDLNWDLDDGQIIRAFAAAIGSDLVLFALDPSMTEAKMLDQLKQTAERLREYLAEDWTNYLLQANDLDNAELSEPEVPSSAELTDEPVSNVIPFPRPEA